MPKRKENKEPSDTPPQKSKSKKAEAPTEPFVDEQGWNVVPPSLIHRDWGTKPNTKIAAFDLDGTLVNVKSGMQFPRSADDWKLFNKKVPAVLKDLHEHGYKIVIFTNQGGIKSALTGAMAAKVKGRMEQFVEKVAIPIQVFMATLDDENRKPGSGMWEFMLQNCNGSKKPDMGNSFFVGDAAGRPADFADSDKAFATTIGLPFKLPEDLFGEMEGKRAIVVSKPAAGAGGGDSGANPDIVDIFRKLAEKFSSSGDKFKSSAYSKAATSLASFPEKISQSNIKEVGKLQGVGKGSLAVITEYLSTGTVEALQESAVPAKQQEIRTATQSAALNFM